MFDYFSDLVSTFFQFLHFDYSSRYRLGIRGLGIRGLGIRGLGIRGFDYSRNRIKGKNHKYRGKKNIVLA